MAAFCKQCSIETFGKDFEEHAGLSTPEKTKAGIYPVVICEGCGPVQVDHTGACVSVDCAEKHGVEHKPGKKRGGRS